MLATLTFSASAQTAATGSAYTGPRYPGGPDSLRALVYRSTRLVSPRPTGRILLQVELSATGQPQGFELLRPAGPSNPELNEAAVAAMRHLKTRMLAWQPGTPDPDSPTLTAPKVSLVLDFSTPLAAQPYAYADQNPVFPDLAALLLAQHNKYMERNRRNRDLLDRLKSFPKGLVTYIQVQTLYPAEALRNSQQGQVSGYFEVAETGSIEHHQILGSAGDALDAEVSRVLAQVPAALTPATLAGKPVRVFYVLPTTFKMQ